MFAPLCGKCLFNPPRLIYVFRRTVLLSDNLYHGASTIPSQRHIPIEPQSAFSPSHSFNPDLLFKPSSLRL